MKVRTDSERLDWVLDQNKRGAILTYVTDRRDVDELMAEDEARDRKDMARFVFVSTVTPSLQCDHCGEIASDSQLFATICQKCNAGAYRLTLRSSAVATSYATTTSLSPDPVSRDTP